MYGGNAIANTGASKYCGGGVGSGTWGVKNHSGGGGGSGYRNNDNLVVMDGSSCSNTSNYAAVVALWGISILDRI
jgi:hypothetical protein